MRKTKVLRELLNAEGTILAPCAFDALSARMIEKTGFKLAGTTGSGMHGVMLGRPDAGLISFSEMVEALGKMCDAVNIPIIADAEGGYGNAINVIRTVKVFERAGLAGLFIEDQQLPTNCPFMGQPPLISTREMVGKIKAAIDAREDSNFVIIARSDAPFEEACERLNIYAEAGADLVKVVPKTYEEFMQLPKLVKAPLHLGFTSDKGIHDNMDAWEIGKAGYKIVTFPMTPFNVMAHSGYEALKKLFKEATDKNISNKFTLDEYFDFIGFDQLHELEEKYLL